MKDNKSGWQFPKALEIIKCKEGNKEFMKERPARRPFGNTVLICEYPIDDTAAEEPNAKLITWRLSKRAARDFLRVSFMPSAIVSAAHGGKPPSASTVNIKSHERSYRSLCTANAIKYLWRWKLKTVKRTYKRRFGISTDLFNERAQTAPQERSYSI